MIEIPDDVDERRHTLSDAVRDEQVLRAAAGDWIKVTLINDFPKDPNTTPFFLPFPK